MSTLTLRLDDEFKDEIKEIAKELGISLNQLINLKLRELKDDKSINISLNNSRLYELSNDKISIENLNLQKKVLKKDKSLFSNI